MTQTLDELEARSDERLAHLFAVIERAGLGDVSLGEAYLGRRGADVLTHLHGWHLFFEGWLDLDEEGAEVVLPQPDRTWDDLRIINDEIFERFRDLTYGEAKALLSSSHAAFFERLRSLPPASLGDPDAHPWSAEPLIDLADECSGKHYDWGIERIDEAIRGA